MSSLPLAGLVAGAVALAGHAQCATFLTPYDTPVCEVACADFGGDGRADLAVRDFATGNVSIYYNTGSAFSSSPSWTGPARSVPDQVNWDCLFGDVTGDGKADLVNRLRTDGHLWFHYNVGNDFTSSAQVELQPRSGRAGANWRTLLGDVNGDGFADVLDVDIGTSRVFVHINTRIGFPPAETWMSQLTGGPAGSWEPLVGDYNGDGKDDFVKVDLLNGQLYYYESSGSSISSSPTTTLSGRREIYEHQSHLADVDGDGTDDLVSHNLRTGDLSAYKVRRSSGNYVSIDHLASMVYAGPSYCRSYCQRTIPETGSRILDALVWYDTGFFPQNGQPDNGWWQMNPNHPNVVPNYGIWRTGTSLLGTYNSMTKSLIVQHAYWLRAMGVDAIIIDWTNQLSARDPDKSIKVYRDWVRVTGEAILSVYQEITSFVPPKLIFVIRMAPNNDPTRSTWMADDVYDFYTRFDHRLFYHFNDGSANKDKPLLLAFVDFSQSAWKTAPQWTDSRFNMRYSNGYLDQWGLTTTESNDWKRVKSDLPYWNFVEVMSHPTKGTGYYRNLYRRLYYGGSYIPEQSATWCALYRGSSGWDGQEDMINGKTCLERFSESLFNKYPRIVTFNRWNYPIGWYDQPQEGLSWNYSTMIEPSQQAGFNIYNKAAGILYDLKKFRRSAPGKPVVTSYNGSSLSFVSSDWPTEYRISATADGSGASWTYLDVTLPSVTLPSHLHNVPLYIKTRNPFGESDATYYQP